MYYTVEITHQATGTLPITDIPCPVCGEKKMVMEFYTERSEAFFYVSTQPAACGDAVCQHCANEIDFLDLKGDLKAFHKHHHKAYRGKFSFKFKKWFALSVGGLLLAGFVNLGFVKYDERERETEKIAQSAIRKAQHKDPKIGAIYYVKNFPTKSPDQAAGGTTNTWLKLVRLEGEKLVFLKHQRELSFQEIYGSEKITFDPSGFTNQEVGVYRNPRYDDFLHFDKDRGQGESFEIVKITLP